MTKQEQLKILGTKNKVGQTWKYLVMDQYYEEFTLQTKVNPKDMLVKLEKDSTYLIPLLKKKNDRQQFRELDDTRLDLIGLLTDSDDKSKEDNDKPAEVIKDLASASVIKGSQLPYESKSPMKFDRDQSLMQPVEVSQLPSKQQVLDYLEMYEFVKQNIVKDTDYQEFTDKNGNKKRFLKKSGFRKFVKPFKLNLEIISQVERQGSNGLEYEVVARCSTLDGQFVDAIAICQEREPKSFPKNKHAILTTAVTRAKNRAISDLVAFGEVSAEELY